MCYTKKVNKDVRQMSVKINFKTFERQLMSLDPNNDSFFFDGLQEIRASTTEKMTYDFLISKGFKMWFCRASHYQKIAEEKGIYEAHKEMMEGYHNDMKDYFYE